MDFLNQIAPRKLLDINYIFEKQPETDSAYLYLGILFASFIIFAFFFGFIYRKKEKLRPAKLLHSKIFNLFLSLGIIGLILIFFRWQGLPYLGSRFIMLLLFVALIVWLANICWYRLIRYPKEIEKIHEEINFKKYLPKQRSS